VFWCARLDQKTNKLIELLSMEIHMKINSLPNVSWLVPSHDHHETCQIFPSVWVTRYHFSSYNKSMDFKLQYELLLKYPIKGGCIQVENDQRVYLIDFE
jgi:hypothetical protein